jgi:hypothetical protein
MGVDPRRRQNMDDDDNNPDGSPPKKMGFNMNMIVPIVVSVALSLILVYFFFNPTDKASSSVLDTKLTESKTEVTKSITDLTSKFEKLKTDITSANTKQINDALVGLPSTQTLKEAKDLAAQAQSTATQSQTTANQAQTDATNAKQTANQSQTTLTQLQSTISQVQTDVNSLKSQVTTNPQVANDVATLKSTVASLQTTVTTLQNKVNEIPAPTPTSTTTPTSTSTGSTSTMGNVVVKVTSYNGTIIPQNSFDFAGNTYGISGISLSSGGSGYQSVPLVTFSGGNGSGAVAHATISNGVVNSVVIDNGGYGYISSSPSSIIVNFSGGGNTTPATATVSAMALTNDTIDPTITLKIINGEAFDISNLIFDVILTSDNDISSSKIVSKLKLSSSNVSFRATYADSTEFDFETSGNGLSVSAGKTKYVYITPSILLKYVFADEDINFNVTVKIVDYDRA